MTECGERLTVTREGASGRSFSPAVKVIGGLAVGGAVGLISGGG